MSYILLALFIFGVRRTREMQSLPSQPQAKSPYRKSTPSSSTGSLGELNRSQASQLSGSFSRQPSTTIVYGEFLNPALGHKRQARDIHIQLIKGILNAMKRNKQKDDTFDYSFKNFEKLPDEKQKEISDLARDYYDAMKKEKAYAIDIFLKSVNRELKLKFKEDKANEDRQRLQRFRETKELQNSVAHIAVDTLNTQQKPQELKFKKSEKKFEKATVDNAVEAYNKLNDAQKESIKKDMELRLEARKANRKFVSGMLFFLITGGITTLVAHLQGEF